MTDRNGVPVTIGAKVRFTADHQREGWVEGWVRAVRNDGMFARVDDGDQHDTLGETFSLAAYVRSDEIEVLS